MCTVLACSTGMNANIPATIMVAVSIAGIANLFIELFLQSLYLIIVDDYFMVYGSVISDFRK